MSNTSKLSHEINNYLSVIYSEIQSIEEKYKSLADDQDWISMKQDTWQLGKLVNSYSEIKPLSLTAASIESDVSLPAQELFSIHNLLQSLSHSWKLRYSRKGFRLTYINQNQKSLKMNGTPFEIVQIFNNLLSNSFDALSQKQKFKPYHQAWFPEACLVLTSYNDQIIIKLEDNGCGISSDKLTRIFDYGITTKSSGHGIGLSVAQELVKKHNGHIYVRSQESKGSIFHIIFPAVLEE